MPSACQQKEKTMFWFIEYVQKGDASLGFSGDK
jgi:hypothetical protein